MQEIEKLLKSIEWIHVAFHNEDYFCPCCKRSKEDGHYKKCQLAQALQRLRTKPKAESRLLLNCETSLNKTITAYKELNKRLDAKEQEIEGLKEFARKIIEDNCWNLGEPDGGSIQDLAEKLGLIEPHIATADDVDAEFSDFDIGDTIYKFSQVLKG